MEARYLGGSALLDVDGLHIVGSKEGGESSADQIHGDIGSQRDQDGAHTHAQGIQNQEGTAAKLIAQGLIQESQSAGSHGQGGQSRHTGDGVIGAHDGCEQLGRDDGLHLTAQLSDDLVTDVNDADDQQEIGHIARSLVLGFFLFPLGDFSLLLFFGGKLHTGSLQC